VLRVIPKTVEHGELNMSIMHVLSILSFTFACMGINWLFFDNMSITDYLLILENLLCGICCCFIVFV
jgi:hypothetical protein